MDLAWIQGATILLVLYPVLMIAMYYRKIPAYLALPLYGLLIMLIGGVGVGIINATQTAILASGEFVLQILFATCVGALWAKLGIIEDLVKRSAELGGGKPIVVAIIMALVTALLHITGFGTGFSIVVGSLVLPIMLSVGIPPLLTSVLFAQGVSLGYIINPIGFQFVGGIVGVKLTDPTVYNYQLILFGLYIVQIVATSLVLGKVLGTRLFWSTPNSAVTEEKQKPRLPLYALLAPFIPVLTSVLLNWPLFPSLLAGAGYAILTVKPEAFKSFTSLWNLSWEAIKEGIASAGAPVTLWIGIQFIVTAFANDNVKAVVSPVVAGVLPNSFMSMFFVLGILGSFGTMFRGPLYMSYFGGFLGKLVADKGIFTIRQWVISGSSSQQVWRNADPTYTSTVWANGYLKVETRDYIKAAFPWAMLFNIIGTIMGLLYCGIHP